MIRAMVQAGLDCRTVQVVCEATPYFWQRVVVVAALVSFSSRNYLFIDADGGRSLKSKIGTLEMEDFPMLSLLGSKTCRRRRGGPPELALGMKHHAKPFLLSVALAVALVVPVHAEMDIARLKAAIETSFEADYPKLDSLYKDLHAHPELAFEEVKTAAKLAAEMRALGFEVTEKVGRTGLVAIYSNGEGPTIMVRTELDALPMEEKTDLPYASRVKTKWNGRETFVAHSCGHDIHMANWVGTAKTLIGLKDQWRGTLMFIAQPAEEIGAGAMAMLADGLFTRFRKPDFAFALHAGGCPYGNVSYRVGVGSSHVDGLYIKFRGRGGHGAMPQRTIDPVMMAARFIVDVQTVISREKDPTEFGVDQHRCGQFRHRRQHHSRRCSGAGHDSQLQAGGARQDAGGDRADGEGGGRDVGCAGAGYPAHRGHQSRHQRSRVGRDRREGAEGGVRREAEADAANTTSEDFSEFGGCRRAVDDVQYRRLRAGEVGGGQQERNAASGQPFAAVRAGSEADLADRCHRHDARRAQRVRSAARGK